DARLRVLDDLVGSTDSHQIARLVGGKMLERGFDNVASNLARFADAQPTNGISREPNVYGSLGRFTAQLRVHPALHNSKQRLRRFCVGTGLCPVQAGRSPASTCPRHLMFMLFKIILAALSPAQRQFHRSPRALSIGRILGALIKS